jgi:TRAP-type mannitol/chloroaromatic compound transport system permease small subunit
VKILLVVFLAPFFSATILGLFQVLGLEWSNGDHSAKMKEIEYLC